MLTSEERCYEPPADLVGMFLRLSEKWGMKFWFGLYDSGKYWASGDYLHEVELNCRLIDEVWARYGHHAAFGGWYISQECSRNTGKIIDLYARLGRHCKAVSGGLPTLISPYIDGSKNISQYKMQAVVPSDGCLQNGYASVINKYAPHPNAAALTRETMFSDEGQTYLALAGAIPTREDFTIADEYKDQVISKDDIANAVLISDADAYSAACETAKTRWEEEVAPLLVQ